MCYLSIVKTIRHREITLIKRNWLAFVFAFALPILLAFWWWGGFNHATVQTLQSEPLYYAYSEYYGDFGNLPNIQQKVYAALRAQHISPGSSVTILYTDPRITKKHDQHARVGYAIPPATTVTTPLQTAILPARSVLRAQVQASMLLAPGMAYQALHNYLKPQGKDIQMPTVEIYTAGKSINQMGVITVDMPD
ncbi:MAG: hypothetical protein ACYCSS_07910 [Sulfuriferula sp.]